MNEDKQFGPLLNSLSPAAMHRLINLLRKELKIDIAKESNKEVK